ncbi:MAG TPA: BTAD domain-containing putative transcriptional regulator [Gaiellaceae bacterium]|nr:BTAD domain-containing putative transcriptional regulator [Gaiellaceae bacterium]
MHARRLEFRILGPLSVRVDGVAVAAGGPKQRALLALLLLSANRVVSRERLVEELFPEQSVNSADHALRNHVSRLRKVLSPSSADEPRLVARPPGYLLRVEPGELDLESFERAAAEGREALASGDAAGAASALRAAEALWRGRPLADLEFERVGRVEAERLEELRLAAIEERTDAELALGRHLALVPELEALVAEYPFRERFRAQLMLALYRCGRQAESLDFYRRTRELLDEELGLEPAVELQQLERAILVQDPALEVAVERRSPPGPLSPEPICPFKGLAPFEAADAPFFFGRERLVDELVPRLQDGPLLAISGPSGIGKSSLLRAGLLPRLSEGGRAVVMRPGERPAAELVRALGSPLPEALARGRLVLAIDQFEEAFSAAVAETERTAFFDALVEAAWDPGSRGRIVLALRADFFGRLASHTELADLVDANHALIGPMTASELRRAIEGPAERAGLSVEPALADALVDDVAREAGGLPLLSTALVDLYDEREGRALTLESYKRTGGVRGVVGRHAEAAFSGLDEAGQAVAKAILLRLVEADGDEAFIRRRVARKELDVEADEGVEQVLATLVERRLLVADDGSVELVHEALIEQWPRLASWLEEDVHGRRLHRHVTQAASEWLASGRDSSELYRGARLAATVEWLEAEQPALNRLEREFVEESRAAFAREAERQRRMNRRLRGLLAAAVALLLAALATGAVAMHERGTARSQATAAIAQRLGAQALVEPRLDRALLLARAGVDLDDSVATRSSLLASLLRSPAAVAVLRGGGARILDDALTPDGRTLVTRGDNGSVAFFDTHSLGERGPRVSTGGLISYCGAIVRPVRAVAFSSDGRTLAVGDSDGKLGKLLLVDTRTHRTRAVVGSQNAVVADVAFAPDRRRLVTGEPVSCRFSPPDEVIVARRVTDGRALRRSPVIHGGRLVGFTSDGRSLLVTSGEQRSLLLDAQTLEPVRSFPISGAAALSPAGNRAAFGRDDGSVIVVDLRTGAQRPMSRRAAGRVLALAFSRDGNVLASTSDDGSVSVWDVPTRSLRERLVGHSGAALGPLFAQDGATLYTGSSDGSAIVWDVRGERRLGRPFRFDPIPAAGEGLHVPAENASTAVATSPDNSLFATSPAPGRVTLWHVGDETVLADLRGPFGYVVSLAFSHDGRLLAATGNAPNTVVWNVATRKIVRILRSPVRAGAAGVAFSPDDDLVATSGVGTSSNPALLRIYVLRTGQLIGNVPRPHNTLQDLDFSPDGSLLASAGLDGQILVWNVARRRLERTIAHGNAILTIRFSPDGKSIATGDLSGNVDFWDPRNGRRVGRALGSQNGLVGSVAYEPDGRELVTVSGDGRLRLWDLATGRLIGAPLPGADTGGWGTSFPDGMHTIAVFGDGTGVIWNVDPSAWKTQACRVANRKLTPIEWHDFLPQRSYRQVCP